MLRECMNGESVDVVFNPLAVVLAQSEGIAKANDALDWMPEAWPCVLPHQHFFYRALAGLHHRDLFNFVRLRSIELPTDNTIKRTHEPFKSLWVDVIRVRGCVAHVPRITCHSHFSTPY